MRVLFTSSSGLGHVLPMLPLGRAVSDRGHAVLFATGTAGASVVEKAGLASVRAGMEAGQPAAEYRARYADEIAGLTSPDAHRAHIYPRMFGAIATPPMLSDLLPIIEQWQPDLLIHEAAELAGPIAAAKTGIPHITHGFGTLLPRQLVEDATDQLAGLWRSVGLDPHPFAGSYDHLYLDIYPPLIHAGDFGHVTSRQLLRTEEPPGQRPTRGERPRVYLTFGTVVNRTPSFQAAVDGLRSLDVSVLITVGPTGDPDAFGPLPGNITVERFVPQAQVLQQCDLVVSHGGSGTLLGALAHGLPQLCLPQMADQFVNARATSAAGAALFLNPNEVSRESVAAAVQRLLSEPSFAMQAERVAAEFETMPSPAEVAHMLEARFN